MRTRGCARRRVFGAGLAAALAFGGAQAMASPADAVQARACTQEGCDRGCRAEGAIAGRCTSTGLCACFW